MIYKCDECANRNKCVENKEQYTALIKVVEAVVRLDREPEFRCWFSLNMKCDYYVAEEDNCGDYTNCGEG